MSKRSRRRKAPLKWIKRAGAAPPKLPEPDIDIVVDANATRPALEVSPAHHALRDAAGNPIGSPDSIQEQHIAAIAPALSTAQHFVAAQHFINPRAPHSHGIRTNPRKGAIARQLLGTLGEKMVEAADKRLPDGDWPLIDRVQNATFGNDTTMQYIEDKYGFRNLLRKAHCFTLDATTSALVADFSLAITQDLDAARRLSIPPFPVTWFDIDNRARIERVKERGVPLTTTAEKPQQLVPRVGWLVHPAHDLHLDGHYLTYCTEFDQGVFVAPLSFFWHTGESTPSENKPDRVRELMERLCFGVHKAGVGLLDAFPATTPFHINVDPGSKSFREQVYALMVELSGELRHLFGLLIAIGAGQLGATSETTPQPKPRSAPFEQKGKTLLPLEHKVLTITLSKRKTAEKVAATAIFHAKKRWHEVRAHWRTKHNPDGSVKWRVPVKAHERGEKRLGVIEKTYVVHK